jgi:hypothetical protein
MGLVAMACLRTILAALRMTYGCCVRVVQVCQGCSFCRRSPCTVLFHVVIPAVAWLYWRPCICARMSWSQDGQPTLHLSPGP